MARDDLGQRLIDAGWQQGVLLPALPSSTQFQLDDPVTTVAKKVKQSLERRRAENSAQVGAVAPGHAMGFGNMKGGKERLVVISQTCDIAKKPTVEPEVLAMRAFFTSDTRTLQLAGGNSTRQFLLDDSRGLVAEFSNITNVEKPLLAALTPEPGAPDELTRRRFAHWLGYRFMRPAHDDLIVKAVVGPILEKLKSLQQAGDPDMAVLEYIHEIRFVRLQYTPPYEVSLLFMVDEPGLDEAQTEELSRLTSHIQRAFVPSSARLLSAAVKHPYEVTLGDFLSTDKLDLDYYTYRGRTYQGLGPLSVN